MVDFTSSYTPVNTAYIDRMDKKYRNGVGNAWLTFPPMSNYKACIQTVALYLFTV